MTREEIYKRNRAPITEGHRAMMRKLEEYERQNRNVPYTEAPERPTFVSRAALDELLGIGEEEQ